MSRLLATRDDMVEVFHWSECDDEAAVEVVADVSPHLDYAKALRNDGTNGFSATREWRHIGHIPLIVAEKWRNELGVDVFDKDHTAKVKALLRDPEWRYLTTVSGAF